eukprot:gene23045-30239_t
MATTASFDALAYSKTAGHPEDTMDVFFTSNGSLFLQSLPISSLLPQFRSAKTMATTAAFDALAYSKTAGHPEDTMHFFFTSNGSLFLQSFPISSQLPQFRSAETIATTAAFDALAYSKTAGHREDTMHVFFTSNGSPYQNFQARIMVATFNIAQKLPGGEKMVAMTRILHRTKPDALMDEIDTFRADPLQPELTPSGAEYLSSPAVRQLLWFPVPTEANSILQQFLDAGCATTPPQRMAALAGDRLRMDQTSRGELAVLF